MDVGGGGETSDSSKDKGGVGIMVSDFVEEHGGYLRLTEAELAQAKDHYPNIHPESRRLLEYSADKGGY